VSNVLNIVLPIAGRGSRFAEKGYAQPKPLIPVCGRPMIDVVLENLRPKRPHRLILLVLQDHLDRYDIELVIRTQAPDALIVPVAQVTEGPACTVLLARDRIDSEAPLMIANTDQWVDVDINVYLDFMDSKSLDGLIMTMRAHDKKWSYVGFDAAGHIDRVVEKEVISDEATVGIYNYRRGSDFVAAADRMIAKNLRVSNEFYVAPAYNEMLAHGSVLGHFNIGSEFNGMYGLGTPQDLEQFLSLEIARCLRLTKAGL
jgi:NDP-sugar pyrophosphorylase family protein